MSLDVPPPDAPYVQASPIQAGVERHASDQGPANAAPNSQTQRVMTQEARALLKKQELKAVLAKAVLEPMLEQVLMQGADKLLEQFQKQIRSVCVSYPPINWHVLDFIIMVRKGHLKPSQKVYDYLKGCRFKEHVVPHESNEATYNARLDTLWLDFDFGAKVKKNTRLSRFRKWRYFAELVHEHPIVLLLDVTASQFYTNKNAYKKVLDEHYARQPYDKDTVRRMLDELKHKIELYNWPPIEKALQHNYRCQKGIIKT